MFALICSKAWVWEWMPIVLVTKVPSAIALLLFKQ